MTITQGESQPSIQKCVVVVGSCNIDTSVRAVRLPQIGETVSGLSVNETYGGKGANQAVAARRMGADTKMIAVVGADERGGRYINKLESEGVCTRGIRRSSLGVPTGVALITVDDETGDNTIVVVEGANKEVCPNDVPVEIMKGAGVVLCQLEVPQEATLHALKLGKAAGAITILNPAPATMALIPGMLDATTILCPNYTELAMLCKCSEEMKNYVQSVEDVSRAARMLQAQSDSKFYIIVTLGEQGALYVPISNTEEAVLIPAGIIEGGGGVIDTVGAGDAFLGTLAAALAANCTIGNGISAVMKTESLLKAIRLACQVASLSTCRMGAQDSYWRLEELSPELQDAMKCD